MTTTSSFSSELQNHRIIEGGRDLRRAQSKFQLKAGSAVGLDQVAQSFVQSHLGNLLKWHLSGQPDPLLVCFPGEEDFTYI